MGAVSSGTATCRRWWYELALYTAWHIAAFNSQTKSKQGLKPWGQIKQQLLGAAEEKTPVSWQARKAARQQQMTSLKKHRQQRMKPPMRRRG